MGIFGNSMYRYKCNVQTSLPAKFWVISLLEKNKCLDKFLCMFPKLSLKYDTGLGALYPHPTLSTISFSFFNFGHCHIPYDYCKFSNKSASFKKVPLFSWGNLATKTPPWLCFSTCQGESLTKQWTVYCLFSFIKRAIYRRRMCGDGYSMAIMSDHRSTA